MSNVLAAGALAALSVADIAAAGGRRISIGAMVARVAHTAIRDATRAILDEGTCAMFSHPASGSEIDRLLDNGRKSGTVSA